MKKTVRRVICALLCSITLSVSVMPVVAADDDCKHTDVFLTRVPKYEFSDECEHKILEVRTYTCQVCKNYSWSVTELKRMEKHSLTETDLGHIGPATHKYREDCTICGGSFEKEVPCWEN